MLQIHKYFDDTSDSGMSIGSTCSEQGVNLQVTIRHRSILVNFRMSVKPLLCYNSRRHSRHYYSSAFQYTVIYTFHWMRTGGTTRRQSYRQQTHLVTSHIAHTQIKQWLQRLDNCISAECILSHYHRRLTTHGSQAARVTVTATQGWNSIEKSYGILRGEQLPRM